MKLYIKIVLLILRSRHVFLLWLGRKLLHTHFRLTPPIQSLLESELCFLTIIETKYSFLVTF